jgi:leucine-rich repeat protein SHOC2
LGHLPLDNFEALPALVEGIRSLNLSNTRLIDEGSYKGREPLAGTSYQGLAALAKLSNLHTLILAGNHLTSLPAELGQVTSLSHLDMRRNQLQALPESVSNMTALVRLLLDGNVGLKVIPDWLPASCPGIEELSLAACGFSAFPFPVLRVPLLRKLRLGRNSPSMTLPSSLVDAQSGHLFMGGLEELSLASLALVDENLFCLEPLKQLKTVDLRENKLVSVPHFLFEVDGLQSLEVSWVPLQHAHSCR